MDVMNMTLGEFYEKADEAVAELNELDGLTLEHFNEATMADFKNAGLLEDPIFLRNGTIYFSIEDVYSDTEEEIVDDSKRARTELQLGTIHASYRDDRHTRKDQKTYALLTEITQKLDYPPDTSLANLAQNMRLKTANTEKERIEQEIEEMLTKLSDYKNRVAELNSVIEANGAATAK